MPRQYNVFGVDDAESFIVSNLTKYIQEGQDIDSGYTYLIITYQSGDYEVFCTLENTEESIVFQTLNLNVNNKKVWTLEPKLICNRDYSDWFSCMSIMNGINSFIPVCIVNPDVLPRISDGEKIQAQVIAFSVGLDTFATEEEMEENFPIMSGMKTVSGPDGSISDLNGKRIGIAQGSIIPIGFLSRHQVPFDDDRHESIEYSYDDDVSIICGKITELRELKADDKENIGCRIITVNTEYGDLDICVTTNDTDYSVGRYILGSIILSANVKIGEYINGAVFDSPHIAKLLYDAIENKDFFRFENVLADDCVLVQPESENIVGKQNVINFLKNFIESNALFSEEIEFDIDTDGVLLIYPSEAEIDPVSFKLHISDKKADTIIMDFFHSI